MQAWGGTRRISVTSLRFFPLDTKIFNSVINRETANQSGARTPRCQAWAEPGVSKLTRLSE